MDNHCQVLFYTSYLHIIGGIETFMKSILELLGGHYDLGIYCPRLSPEMRVELSARCPVWISDEPINCDTLIMVRMSDDIPKNVTYKHSIRMCHACKVSPDWRILNDCDRIVHVSRASKKTFGTKKADVILNPVLKTKERAITLVSATRIPAPDKGLNTDRMLRFARMLEKSGIPFIWLNFSDHELSKAPKGFVNMGPVQDLQPYIAKADYLVQLSDQEGFGYSVAEALVNHTAVIVTPFETTKELGVVDGVNGYIVPYDMRFDVHKLLDVPEFDYSYDNDWILHQWVGILGETKAKGQYHPENIVKCRVIHKYDDLFYQKTMREGDTFRIHESRARFLRDDLKVIEII